MRRNGLTAGAALTLAVLLCAMPAFVRAQSSPAPARPLVHVRLVQAARDLAFLPIEIAIAKGYFKNEGVDLEVTYTQGGPPAVNAVLAHDADIAAVSLPVLFPAIEKGQTVVGVGAITVQDTNVVVVSSAIAQKSGFTRQTPLDQRLKLLRGLRLATNGPGSGADLVARMLLRRENLNPDTDAQLIPVGAGAPAMVAALRAGTVDAIFFDAVAAREAETQGFGSILVCLVCGDVPEIRNKLHIVLASTKTYADTNGPTLQALDRALYRALKYIHSDPDGALAVALSINPALAPDVAKSAFALVRGSYAASPVATTENVTVAVNYYQSLTGRTLAVPQAQLVDNRAAAAAVKEIDKP